MEVTTGQSETVTTPETPAAVSSQSESVSYETHRRLLDEKKKIQAKLVAFEAEKKASEEAELTRKGEIQKLLDMAKKEAEELRAKVKADEELRTQGKKLSSVVRALGSNVDEKWYGVIGQHIDDIMTNPDTGEIEQMSVTSVVDKLKKTWPEMLKKQAAGMPNEAPMGNGSTTISRDEWLKLTAKDMKKWRPEQVI